MRVFTVILVVLLMLGCEMRETPSDKDRDKQEILSLIKKYQEAVNKANPDMLNDLFWLDDKNFSEIENDRPYPFGKEHFLKISDWIRKNTKPGNKQRFYETKVSILSNDVAYSISMRDELQNNTKSRVTLIFLKKNGKWKIIHGHFSYVP